MWTFKLDPNLMWNDGTPVTSADYVASFQFAADPTHAWDFTWYYEGTIKNFSEAVKGEAPVDQIGVTAVDDHTLQFTTVNPAPYLPAMLIFSNPLQKKALETVGPFYNSDPADFGLVWPVQARRNGPRISAWSTRSTQTTRAPTFPTWRS